MTDSTSRSRESGSRRNRSRRRSRRDGSRSHSSHRSRIRFKQKEKNFAAAVCSMITIVTLCTALAEPNWISLSGGGCTIPFKGDLHHLGAYQFFYDGTFHQNSKSLNSYKFVMTNCVTFTTVLLFKFIIAFCFLGILCSLFAFLLDLMGPAHRFLKMLRRNAIFSILSVLMCVVVNLFCYYVTVYVSQLQKTSKLHKGSKVEVSFDISFYLVTAAGGISVFSVACNCLRQRSPYEESRHNYIMNEYDDLNSLLPNMDLESPSLTSSGNIPPPPAYTP
ncbi:hypothetical protein LOTGIDRAFT_115322 [Lottia gigantea]|uniref:Transmembrane protein 127 transmembrane region domain-containing protein n=1 Tax=Lottia gigantea TaxID=225164 RepID=V4AQ08_LOTGI|nr:hypothetical protein LOTGIDRAFT_115322 [Lottia gigantea]ESO96850.1 hypothetical protein LOTGIDRAFT_115322 [Lottia gigantea]